MVKLLDITGKAISGEWGTDCDHQDGIPVLRTTNFRNNGTINYDNVVIRNIIKDVKNKFLCYGDIIIEKSGGSDKQPVGRVVYFDGKGNRYLFNNFTGVLRVKNTDRWNPKYIFYALFAAYKRGETRRFENRTTCLHNLQLDSYVKNFNIQEISITYQNKICDILDNIHHQIILREKELTHLDDLVKARFVEMFGDPGLPNRNYPIIQLEDIADVKSSHRIFTSDFVEEGIPFYRGKEIGELSRGEVPKEVYYISTEKYKEISNDDSKPLIGDLLMPSICDKGQVWMVNTESPFYYKDGRVLCISPDRNRINPQYFQHYIKMRTISEYPKLGSGSTFAEFKIFQLKRLMISLPPLDRQNQFAEIVTRINKSKSVIQKSLDETQILFQSLMQEYFG